jgi:peptidoglycan/LPS O-acetylase OafA/YrhL
LRIIQKIFNIFRLNPDYNKRVFGLDLMRSLAIIFVVLGHGGWMLKETNTEFPWIRLIDGVELFFVLSGFLIGGILIKIFESEESLKLSTIWNFWIRRWFRTLPNYYLILFVNVIFVYFGVINMKFDQFNWKFLFFLQNFSQPFFGFFWESWSLSIEEWFYIFFPLVLACVYLVSRWFKVSKRFVFLVSIVFFLLTPLLLRVFVASSFEVDNFWLGVKIYKVVIYRLDGIALGLLAAYIKYWHPSFWYKSRNISFILGIILSYIVLYASWPPNDFSTKVFKLTYISLGCFLLIAKFDSMKTAPLIITKIFTHISLISYSMYLINLALVSAVIRDNFPPEGATSAWLLYILYWAIVFVVSTLLFKYYEKPLMDLRDRFKR